MQKTSDLFPVFVRSSSSELWRDNVNGRWATVVVLLFIFVWHTFRRIRFRSVSPPQSQIRVSTTTATTTTSQSRISEIVSDVDLRNLVNNLDGIHEEEMKWDDVIDKRNNLLSYNAKCCKPKNGPLTYKSVTIFENCSAELLRDFYMDNDYRVQWDRTMVDYKQLQVDETNGLEIGRTVKKFPLLTPREYILAWRLWKGKENAFYCFTKGCEHILAPLQKKYVRVGYFRSGWRITEVPGRNACEIKMFHQEDAGLNVEMAKLFFSKGIWSYVCKMDAALHKYTPDGHPQASSIMTAVTLMQRVPFDLDATTTIRDQHTFNPTSISGLSHQGTEIGGNALSRRPSKKTIANGLLFLGGLICLSRGHSSLSGKIAMAFILKKLTNQGAGPTRGGPS